jgi:fatty-acid peroxygenase
MPSPRLDQGLPALTKGYAWLPDLRRSVGRRVFRTRLAGLPAAVLEGPDGVRWFYDEDHVRRSGALPEPVVGTLFGKGAVHTLDGEAHRVRKAMFVALLMDAGGIAALVERVEAAWDDAAAGWAARGEVVLHEEAAAVLARAVVGWAGIPLPDADVPAVARDLVSMIDGFGGGGPRHIRARRARGRRERWLARLVEDVRSGAATVPARSAVEVVSYHRDSEGHPLDARVAAVELLNMIRPTVAISWFLAFSGHALALWPQHRERLATGDPAVAEAWAHEVRRFYPFAPFLGGRTPAALQVGGERVRKGAMVVLDVYGQLHDGDLWEDPYAFRPERFLDREIGAFDLIPQGGGDPRTNHRCPGEQIVVAVLSALAVRLARLDAELPPQDLDIALHRIPALPASRIRLRVHGSEPLLA